MYFELKERYFSIIKVDMHKDFTLEMINCLMSKAIGEGEPGSISSKTPYSFNSPLTTPRSLIIQQTLRMKREAKTKKEGKYRKKESR